MISISSLDHGICYRFVKLSENFNRSSEQFESIFQLLF
nr:MAG TPA: hypothetical protein [Bacteriophage sp.]